MIGNCPIGDRREAARASQLFGILSSSAMALIIVPLVLSLRTAFSNSEAANNQIREDSSITISR
jgi:hypothetical protein